MTTPSTPPVRAFLAVDVAPSIHATLVQLKRELAATGTFVRWARDDGLHATVKFLGPVAPDKLDQVRGTLSEALRSVVSFAVHVGGLGVFPTLRRPRVLWVGLRATELVQLAGSVDRAIVPLGFPSESRAFRAHITLGRVKSPRGSAQLEAVLKTHWDRDFGTCDIEELTAYRSDLHHDGAVYTKQWTIPLWTPKRRS